MAVEVTHMYPPEQIAGLSGEDAEALRNVPAASAFIRPVNWRPCNRGAAAIASPPGA